MKKCLTIKLNQTEPDSALLAEWGQKQSLLGTEMVFTLCFLLQYKKNQIICFQLLIVVLRSPALSSDPNLTPNLFFNKNCRARRTKTNKFGFPQPTVSLSQYQSIQLLFSYQVVPQMRGQVFIRTNSHGSPLILLDFLYNSQVDHASLPLGW